MAEPQGWGTHWEKLAGRSNLRQEGRHGTRGVLPAHHRRGLARSPCTVSLLASQCDIQLSGTKDHVSKQGTEALRGPWGVGRDRGTAGSLGCGEGQGHHGVPRERGRTGHCGFSRKRRHRRVPTATPTCSPSSKPPPARAPREGTGSVSCPGSPCCSFNSNKPPRGQPDPGNSPPHPIPTAAPQCSPTKDWTLLVSRVPPTPTPALGPTRSPPAPSCHQCPQQRCHSAPVERSPGLLPLPPCAKKQLPGEGGRADPQGRPSDKRSRRAQ